MRVLDDLAFECFHYENIARLVNTFAHRPTKAAELA